MKILRFDIYEGSISRLRFFITHEACKRKNKHNCEMIAYRQVKQIVLSSTVIYTEIKL